MASKNSSGGFLINLHKISYFIKEKKILEGIDFSLFPKEIITLMGPNGAGKTTLIKIIPGIFPPTQGHVVKKDQLRIGYMPQKLSLNSALPLTVRKFLDFCQTTGPKKKGVIEKILDLVNAQKLMDQNLYTLSGGEFQKILLVQALLNDPHILILDEPTQGMDAIAQKNFYQMLGDLRDEKGYSILIVSHDLHLVMAACDQVICLNRHICCSGSPDSVQQSQAYQDMFPNMRQLAQKEHVTPYIHNHDHAHD